MQFLLSVFKNIIKERQICKFPSVKVTKLVDMMAQLLMKLNIRTRVEVRKSMKSQQGTDNSQSCQLSGAVLGHRSVLRRLW